MSQPSSEGEEEVGVLIAAKDVALKPLKVAVSKPARRAYLSSVLFIITSLALLGVAVTSYGLFYYSYIPQRGFSRTIYLQYDADRYPYGNTPLSNQVISGQPYDVKLVLHVPRTPANKAAGNFMVQLDLLGAGDNEGRSRIVATARRPTILPYYSDTLEHMKRFAGILWYLLGWRDESETIEVKMMEGIEFSRGWRNIPSTANIEIQSEPSLQVYNAILKFNTKLRGLRYLMYRWKITSFVFFTGMFWATEMGVAAIIWAVLSFFVFAKDEGAPAAPIENGKPTIKAEEMSDTERTFPSLSKQHPLRYSSPGIKSEEDVKPAIADIPVAAEADIEDEEEDVDFVSDDLTHSGFHDSGIGTSMESGVEKRDKVRRRTSRGRRDR